ncbi:MAG TPA: hypothetical protein VG407_17770 [Caulobacteraceae bacterium]|nr:hypothetical protein [Caulobacteraceae bacterium]
MTRIFLGLALAALALTACQKPANKSVSAQEIAAGRALADAKAKAAPGPVRGVSQISTSGSPRGYGLHLPPPHTEADGRNVTVSLPYRPSDGLAWSVETIGAPWKLTSTRFEPKAGPEGSDLAVFSFEAAGPGTGGLAFQLASAAGAAKAVQDHVLTYQVTVIAP